MFDSTCSIAHVCPRRSPQRRASQASRHRERAAVIAVAQRRRAGRTVSCLARHRQCGGIRDGRLQGGTASTRQAHVPLPYPRTRKPGNDGGAGRRRLTRCPRMSRLTRRERAATKCARKAHVCLPSRHAGPESRLRRRSTRRLKDAVRRSHAVLSRRGPVSTASN